MKFQISGIIFLISGMAQAMNMNEYMNKVVEKHSGLKSSRASQEAANLRVKTGDMQLVPVLTLKAGVLSDKKLPNSLGASEMGVTQYSLGVAKKFSTGTALSVTASTSGIENKDLTNPMFSSWAKYAQGAISIGLQQSLWKDAFGAGTRLRWQREETARALEWTAADLQYKQTLIESEVAFWDLIYSQEELKIRQSSLERSKKIQGWIARRVNDGIGDKADALSAEALVTSRQLQLAMAEDDITANRKKVQDILEMPSDFAQDLSENLDQPRNLESMLEGKGSDVLRLDAWLAHLEAQLKTTVAEEVKEGVKSDLSLSASYSTNSYEANGGVSDGMTNWTKTDRPTTQVGLSWTYLFDVDAKTNTQETSNQEALSSQLKRHRKLIEGRTAWSEMNRRYSELSRKIEMARKIVKIQFERARTEADKLTKGRTVTANVVNSEQDAAEAELTLTKLLVERRKLEAQAQLFVRVQGELL